jgi:hypothetical protein
MQPERLQEVNNGKIVTEYFQIGQSAKRVARLTLEAKFDDFDVGSASRKSTYPVLYCF